MVTPLPPRRPAVVPEPAAPVRSAPIPEWVRHFPEFPRLEERVLDDPAEHKGKKADGPVGA